MLSILATALGPLLVDDVVALARGCEVGDPLAASDAVEALERFVVGDGREHGWVFSHQRLREYFRDFLGKVETGRWMERFVEYGAETAAALASGSRSPDDAPAYAVQWYSTHLALTRAPLESFDVLAKPPWLKAWEALEGAEDGFLGDLRNAQERASDILLSGTDDARIGVVARQCRFALVTSSLTSLARNIPPSLLRALIREGPWTPEHALAYVRRMVDESARASGLASIAQELPRPMLADALEIVRTLADESARAYTLGRIAPSLGEDLIDEVLAFTESIEDDDERARTLAALAPHLAGRSLADAVAMARRLGRGAVVAGAKAALAEHLEPPQREELAEEAFLDARQCADPLKRALALSAVAPSLRPPHNCTAWQEFLDAVEETTSNVSRSVVLASAAEHLPDDLVARIPEVLDTFTDIRARDRVTSAFAPRIPEAKAHRLLKAIASRPLDNGRMGNLAAFASATSPEIVRAALAVARLTPEGFNYARTVGVLAARLANLGFADEGFAEVRRVPMSVYARGEAIEGLAPALPDHLIDAAVVATESLDSSEVYDAAAIGVVAARVAAAGRSEQALAIARAIQHPDYQLVALRRIAPYLEVDELGQAVEVALSATDRYERSETLSALSDRLLAVGNPERAVDLAEAISDRDGRLRTVERLADTLPSAFLTRAESVTRLISDRAEQSIAIARLIRYVGAQDHQRLYTTVLELANALTTSAARADVLEALMPNARPGQVDDTIRAARGVPEPLYRQISLSAFLPRLVEIGELERALTVARDLRRVVQLVSLVGPETGRSLLDEAVQEARSYRSGLERTQALGVRSSLLEGAEARDLIDEALAAARDFAAEGGKWAFVSVVEYSAGHTPTARA